MAVPEDVQSAHASLEIYSSVFLQIGIVTGVIAVLMLITAPMLSKMTQ